LSNKPKRLIPLHGIKDGFADYEKLLNREKKGKPNYIFDEDGPNEKSFKISELLDGIPSDDEVRFSEPQFKELSKKLDNIKSDTEEIKITEEKIFAILDEVVTKLDKNTVGEELNKIILAQPNFFGLGININALVEKYLKRKNNK